MGSLAIIRHTKVDDTTFMTTINVPFISNIHGDEGVRLLIV